MATITMPEYDERKLKELILYVADRCEADPTFGAIKLNKTLFYADFLAFASTGKPITGVETKRCNWARCLARCNRRAPP